MRKYVAVFVVLVLALAASASAKTYPSSFGYTFDAPDTSWLVLTKTELASNPVFASVDAGLKAKVASGSIEILYDRATSDATFTDYVDIKLGPKGTVPGTPDAVNAACTAYSAKLTAVAKKPLAVTTCESRNVGALKAFYVEYDGSVAGTVTMQYQIVRPDGRLLYVTAVCKKTSLPKFRPDFEAIVKSIRFS